MTAATSHATIEVQSLTRTFGDKTVVDDVSFTVQPGLLTGFIGANGAGKTTTMRMIAGTLSCTAGQILWSGQPIEAEHHRTIGYMPEERGLFPTRKILPQLVYLATLRGADPVAAQREALDLLDRFNLGDRAQDPLRKLSLGNQQRVQVIAAVMTNPRALILDEPFSGLDPQTVAEMSALLVDVASRGVPVLFSSHQLDLMDKFCDRAVILRDGKIVAEGGVEQLRRSRPLRYELQCEHDCGWVRELPDITGVEVMAARATFLPNNDAAAQHVLHAAIERGAVKSFGPLIPQLSDVFAEVTQ